MADFPALGPGLPMQPLPRMRHLAPNVTDSETPQSGTLQIVDHFTPQVDDSIPPMPNPNGGLPFRAVRMPHGIRVTDSALQTGYQGRINTSEFPNPQIHSPAMLLSFRGQTPEQTLEILDTAVRLDSGSVAVGAMQSLNTQAQAGVRNTVTNFSMAGSPSNITEHLYHDISLAWNPARPDASIEEQGRRFTGQGMSENLARAWNIDPAALTSADPAISGPARQQFQQNLINRTSQAVRTPEMDQLRERLNSVVDGYESRNNSVVVAAGNNGDLAAAMRRDNGGRELQFPEGFYDNILATPNATTVGALGVTGANNQIGVAGYSSPTPTVDLNAWGNPARGVEGTSFAAPRVAAQMQELHNRFPDRSSAQIERMLRDQCYANGNEITGCRLDTVQ
ncbi:MAG: S8/S53 family peptidase [Candidatus Eremiobacteraeota bacterium]|nr:S8/S53 family peptidase [Candidatus Eremiobacteraeota bacterium]MCW5866220.1 S8/S53 family peptidase [Candidatus Eremiobacteraeota bacterium]